MKINREIESVLKKSEADFVYFVDVRHLPALQNRGFPHAILFGIVLSPSYLQTVMNTPDYVQERIKNNSGFSDDEYYLAELKTGRLADEVAELLTGKGHGAFSHSDENQMKTGIFDGIYQETPLPHKTIASGAGIGWIGKNNLMVTRQFGCGFCLGAILTDAPLETALSDPAQSECGACNLCADVCKPKVLKGNFWNASAKRDDMIDVYKCITCLNCLVFCPWTQKYIAAAQKK